MTSPSTQATRPAPSQRVPRASLGHRGVLSSSVPPCTFLHASQIASCTSHASSWQPSFHVFACQRSASNEPYEFRTTRSPGKRGIAKTVCPNGPQCPSCSRGGSPEGRKGCQRRGAPMAQAVVLHEEEKGCSSWYQCVLFRSGWINGNHATCCSCRTRDYLVPEVEGGQGKEAFRPK